jgi:hypothetical protein
MTVIDGYHVTVKIREAGFQRFSLIVETAHSAGGAEIQQWPVPHEGGYISIDEATRMAGYVLKGIDRVSTDGRPNLNVV